MKIPLNGGITPRLVGAYGSKQKFLIVFIREDSARPVEVIMPSRKQFSIRKRRLVSSYILLESADSELATQENSEDESKGLFKSGNNIPPQIHHKLR
jgi:hypothetical protein